MSCTPLVRQHCDLPKPRRRYLRAGTVHACAVCRRLHRVVLMGAADGSVLMWERIDR